MTTLNELASIEDAFNYIIKIKMKKRKKRPKTHRKQIISLQSNQTFNHIDWLKFD